MFYKAVTYEIDDGDIENGPGKSYEAIWSVCRANSIGEARIILTKLRGTSLKGCDIVEASEDEYDEYLFDLTLDMN